MDKQFIVHSFNILKNEVAGGLYDVETINLKNAANFSVMVNNMLHWINNMVVKKNCKNFLNLSDMGRWIDIYSIKYDQKSSIQR